MKKPPPRAVQDPETAPHKVAALASLAIFPVLTLIALAVPENVLWGIGDWAALQTVPRFVLLGLSALPLLLATSGRISTALTRALNKMPALTRHWWSTLLLFFLVAGLLFLGRLSALEYGDGYSILTYYESGGGISLEKQFALQPLSVITNWLWYHALTALFDLGAQTVLALFTAIAGAAALAAIWRVCRLVCDDLTLQVVLFLFTATSGTCLLFFGYIEQYTWGTTLSIWSLAYCLQFLKHGKGKVGALLCASLAAAFHLIALPQLVIALLVVTFPTQLVSGRPFGLKWPVLILTTVVASAAFVFTVNGLASDSPFVALLATDAVYTAFSAAHLSDMVNLGLFVAPLAICAALVLLLPRMRGDKSTTSSNPAIPLLGLCSLFFALATFWIDPELGAIRDWDLLSLYGVPLSILSGYVIVTRLGRFVSGGRLILIAGAAAILLLGPKWYTFRASERAVDRLDRILSQDPHYSVDYAGGERALPWANVLRKFSDRPDLAEKYMERRLSANASSATSLFGLGELQIAKGNYDSAYVLLQRARVADTANPFILAKLAHVMQQRRQYDEALTYSSRAVQLNSTDPFVLTTHGIGLARLNRVDEALRFLRQAHALLPDSREHMLNLAVAFKVGEYLDSAYIYFERGLQLSSQQESVPLLAEMAIIKTTQGDRSKAEELLATLARLAPQSPQYSMARDYFRSRFGEPGE